MHPIAALLIAAVERGELDEDLANETIGVVTFWYHGYPEHSQTAKSEWYAEVLRSAGATVPWETHD